MPVTHGVASSSLVQTANTNRESLSPNGWGTFAFNLCLLRWLCESGLAIIPLYWRLSMAYFRRAV